MRRMPQAPLTLQVPGRPLMPFDQQSIAAGIGASLIGCRLLFVPSFGSTQDLARDLALHGAPEGTLVVADEQSAGRGRLSRRWVAPAGSSLLMSLLLRPKLAACRLHQVTMACSLGIVDGVREATGLETGIKWPNDIVTLPDSMGTGRGRVRKLAGLLTESGFAGEHLDYAVVGMGINVNLEEADLPEAMTPATSLSIELGRPVERLSLLLAILPRIQERYLSLPASDVHANSGPNDILAAWSARLVTLGQVVHVTSGQEVVDGRAESVDADGALLVRIDDGQVRRFIVGDVSLRGNGRP
jgi:BirA family biotin operon repressor/biotin-[acetyl-CoA-carboxylase] ligase